MTDKELLEYAAKAAGIEGHYSDNHGFYGIMGREIGCSDYPWNPMTNDGQALRLAVKLDFHLQMDFDDDNIECVYCWSTAHSDGSPERITNTQDRYAATRRAIVSAAAQVGREME